MLLYRDNLATLLAEASEVGRGLLRYVERDYVKRASDQKWFSRRLFDHFDLQLVVEDS